ncbi:MAG: AAA family ATPase [Victivallales bacterium]|jgi:predicted ATPase|nr:AAA family ATPase [Victivallales bacterium]MBT7055231.1 AAA family ATPase [Lentisphaerota bacterium]MBT7302266.1 AAA family ATPase [Victivallales bacterium]
MITQLEVSNYRSLRDVRLKLGRLTALVGQNGSGKSNIADVFRFVSEALRVGLDSAITSRHGIKAVRRWSSGRPFNLRISLRVNEDGFDGGYEFELTGDRSEEYRVKREHAWVERTDQLATGYEFTVENGEWHGPKNLSPKVSPTSLSLIGVAGDERFAPLAECLRDVEVYSIFPDTLRIPQKHDPVIPMKRHGENWATALRDLGESGRGEMLAALGKLTGDITSMRVQPVASFLSAEFQHQPQSKDGRAGTRRPKWFDADQESDGTLRVAGILTALLQNPAPRLVGIEEPELTVHVGAIRLIHDFLYEASWRTQVLITTHSSELLDLIDPDCVRVVTRSEGATEVSELHASQVRAVKQRLATLGEVARTEGLQPAEKSVLEVAEE